MSSKFQFSFRPVDIVQKSFVYNWISQDHIKEWLHGEGLQNTIKDIEDFFKGKSVHQHWIAYDQETPFGYLLTSRILKESPDEDQAKWCQETGEAITLDLFICNKNYLGKGHSVPMIQEFLLSCFPYVSEVLIDPEISNQRAVHVYEKAGFEIIDEFIAPWHPVPHYKMRLNMMKLIERHSKF